MLAASLSASDPVRTSARSRANCSQLDSIQNDSGPPQGPGDPFPGRLLMRQTACARRSLAGMIGDGTRGREPMPRIKRRDFIALLGGAAVAWPLDGCKQGSVLPSVPCRASPINHPHVAKF
jgi:hypothetical protein